MKPILLFDIDGTLLRVKKPFMATMIQALLDDVNINNEVLAGMSFAGRTDRDIFGDLAARQANPEVLFDTLKKRYIAYLKDTLTNGDVHPVEGAREGVMQAVNAGLNVGLCTGNFREAAFYKVHAIGLNNIFRFGGFGCSHADRKHLPFEAHLEYSGLAGYEPEPRQYVVIGDTPNDVRCAAHFGAVSVAVTTGGFSAGELEKYSPDYILNDLRELLPILETSEIR